MSTYSKVDGSPLHQDAGTIPSPGSLASSSSCFPWKGLLIDPSSRRYWQSQTYQKLLVFLINRESLQPTNLINQMGHLGYVVHLTSQQLLQVQYLPLLLFDNLALPFTGIPQVADRIPIPTLLSLGARAGVPSRYTASTSQGNG